MCIFIRYILAVYSVVNCFYPLKTKKTLLCIAAYSYIIAMYNPELPKRQNPFLAKLRSFSKKPIFKDIERMPGLDRQDSLKGLLGNYLMRQMTPDSMDIDLLSQAFRFRPNDRFEMGLRQRDGNSLLNLNWRF